MRTTRYLQLAGQCSSGFWKPIGTEKTSMAKAGTMPEIMSDCMTMRDVVAK